MEKRYSDINCHGNLKLKDLRVTLCSTHSVYCGGIISAEIKRIQGCGLLLFNDVEMLEREVA